MVRLSIASLTALLVAACANAPQPSPITSSISQQAAPIVAMPAAAQSVDDPDAAKAQTDLSSAISAADSVAVQAGTTVKGGPHDPNIVLEGPFISVDGKLDGTHYALRAFVPAANRATVKAVQFVIATYSKDWRHYHSAYHYGRTLPTVRISQEVISCVGGCLLSESVGITISMDDLKAAANGKGFSVKLAGKAGEVTVDAPAPYFAGFLAKLNQQRQGGKA